MTYIFFIYGLAFFSMGLAILLLPKKGSVFAVVHELWAIGAFGIVHGINEWLDMFIIIHSPEKVAFLEIARMITLPLSFLFLIQFSTTSIRKMENVYPFMKALPLALLLVWGIMTLASANHFVKGDIWARYILAGPGIFLTVYAFYLQSAWCKEKALPEIAREFSLAACSFALYGFFAAVIVPPDNFFPASFVNSALFLDSVHLPVQLFRTACAVIVAFSMMRVLRLFDYTMQENIKQMAYHDPLTGLPNRIMLDDCLSSAMLRARAGRGKLAVMMIDVDKFKEVNDRFGHATGDCLLQAVGKRLTKMLRKSDMIARMGGDEFMVLLAEVRTDDDADVVALKIISAFQEQILCEGHEFRSTVSVGIALCPDDGNTSVALVRAADVAMYRAKKRGRNTFQRYHGEPQQA
ncbi:MAG: GGDEF domain-containing protein [Candidatus Aureabacteria bacterium]|nr:GGDEF domain-containing protein [Candidatus Auribacterota bacterium]